MTTEIVFSAVAAWVGHPDHAYFAERWEVRCMSGAIGHNPLHLQSSRLLVMLPAAAVLCWQCQALVSHVSPGLLHLTEPDLEVGLPTPGVPGSTQQARSLDVNQN